MDVDAAAVLRHARHLVPVTDRHAQLVDPPGQEPLGAVLRQREAVGVAGRGVAEVQGNAGEPGHLGGGALREEPLGDAALVEDLDGPAVQAEGAPADDLLAGTPLEDDDVDPRQRQLARQHQAGRATADHHHGVLFHVLLLRPRVPLPARAFCGPSGVLPQAPWAAVP